jgi:isocitrate dehydrogenase
MTDRRSWDVPPADGQEVGYDGVELVVPDRPIIPFIEGDGIGPEIVAATRSVTDAAVAKTSGGARSIAWFEVLAGGKAQRATGDWLPPITLEALSHFRIGLKGPLTTPVGGGHRSLNVALRRQLDLYACIRPVRYYAGVPSPLKEPEKVDIVTVRENTEDVYMGYEVRAESRGAARLRSLLDEMGMEVAPDSAIGLKPISATASKRLVRKAIRYAIEHQRRSVTLVHKGNIMKFTEGAFRDWGYQVAREEFGQRIVTAAQLAETPPPHNRVILRDVLADAMFQQILLRPEECDVLATPNLNGDYLSDFLAAQVGGLGMAPGSNEGDGRAVFEATHGSAPLIAGQDQANPCSLILSSAMMLRRLGWSEAAAAIETALQITLSEQRVTHDLAQQLGLDEALATSEFARAVVGNLP